MNKDYKELYWNLKFDYNVIKEDYDRLKHYDNQRVEMLRVLQEQYSELEKENEELLNKLNNKGENKMKKYSYRSQYKRIRKDESLFWGEWSEELFSDKEEIEGYLKQEIEEDSKDSKYKPLIAVDYEFKEVEIKEIEIEGLVTDYGEYEDYTVAVGDTKIERLIIDKFKDQKIRVKIEVLE